MSGATTPRCDPKAALGRARERHLEGIVAKRLNAPYQLGRRGEAWLEHKHRHRERLTITAWRPGQRREPDEVLVAGRDGAGTLRYAGGVRYLACRLVEEPQSHRGLSRPLLRATSARLIGQPGR